MNKRIAKKKYKKALEESIKDSRRKEISVTITNQAVVDKNGKPCNPKDEGSRFILFKRPHIEYIKSEDKEI